MGERYDKRYSDIKQEEIMLSEDNCKIIRQEEMVNTTRNYFTDIKYDIKSEGKEDKFDLEGL